MARAFRLTGIAAGLAWIALMAWAGYFRFDDFWSIHHSRGSHLFSNAAWHGLTADGLATVLTILDDPAGTELLSAFPGVLADVNGVK